MNTVREIERSSVYTNEEMNEFKELKSLVDYYREKTLEDPNNAMNTHWFHYYKDRVVVFLMETDKKHGLGKISRCEGRKPLADLLRQPMILQAC